MPKILRFFITLILIFFGIYFLGFNPENPNVDKLTILGVGCLISAWALNSISKTDSKKGIINLLNTEMMREIKDFEKKLKEQPSPQGKLQLAEMYLKIGKPQKTLEVLDSYSADVSENMVADYLRMIAHFGLREFSKAWDIIEKLYAKDETFDGHKIKLWAARCYIELLEPENAIKFVDLFIQKTGISAEAFYTKGIAYSRLGDKDNANLCLDELQKMHDSVPKMRKLEIKIMIKAMQKEISESQ